MLKPLSSNSGPSTSAWATGFSLESMKTCHKLLKRKSKKARIQCILLVNRINRGLFLKISTVTYLYCLKNVDLTITTSTKMTNQKSTRNVCLFFHNHYCLQLHWIRWWIIHEYQCFANNTFKQRTKMASKILLCNWIYNNPFYSTKSNIKTFDSFKIVFSGLCKVVQWRTITEISLCSN